MGLKKKNYTMLFPRINKVIIIVFALAFVAAGTYGYKLFNYVFEENVLNPGNIIIKKDASYEQVVKQLRRKEILKNYNAFDWVSKKKNYPESVRSGKYLLEIGMNNNQIVNMLKAANQEPVKVTFNNLRYMEELAGTVSKYIEPDSTEFMKVLSDESTFERFGFDQYTFHCMFIPNTYEFYWTATVDQFLERMSSEYKRFWNEDRLRKAKMQGLTPEQVMTLASIVQEETNKSDEKPIVAGLYLNRLKRRMALQADPTIKFALGDFSIQRVLNQHLKIDSPYNTYKNKGLPPGPINFPEISSINAVLNAEKNNYLYMCAREDFSGYHNFASSLREHNENARKYKRALDKNRIFK